MSNGEAPVLTDPKERLGQLISDRLTELSNSRRQNGLPAPTDEENDQYIKSTVKLYRKPIREYVRNGGKPPDLNAPVRPDYGTLGQRPGDYQKRGGVLGTAYDYLLNPIARYTAALPQAASDLATGITGSEPINLRAEVRSMWRQLDTAVSAKPPMTLEGGAPDTGKTHDQLYREELARDAALGNNLIGKGAEIAGNVRAIFGGMGAASVGEALKAGQVSSAAMKIAAKAAGVTQIPQLAASAVSGIARVTLLKNAPALAARLSESLPQIAPLAAGFGALEAAKTQGHYDEAGKYVAPTMGERAMHGLFSSASYPLFELAGDVARTQALRIMAQGGKGREFVLNWAKEHNLEPAAGEEPGKFLGSVINQFVQSGEGLGKIQGESLRKLSSWLATSGIEGTGMNVINLAMDAEYRHDVLAAILSQDSKAFARAFDTTVSGYLGIAALKAGGLANIYQWQRAQPTKQAGEAPPPEAPPQEPGAPPQDPQKLLTYDRKAAAAETLRAGEFSVLLPGTIELGYENQLQRLGWQPVTGPDGKPAGGEIPGSPYGFEILPNGNAKLTTRLAESLGVDQELPSPQAMEILANAHTLSALQSKVVLPGQQITTDGGHAEIGTEAEPGKMRVVRFGDIYEHPLSPDGKWIRVDDAPRREPDLIEPDQRHVLDQVAQLIAERQDLDPASRALGKAAVDVLANVSSKKDPAVAETLQVLQQGALTESLVGPPEQAKEGIRTLSELLTTKNPEVVAREIVNEQQAQPQEQAKPQVEGGARDFYVLMRNAEGATEGVYSSAATEEAAAAEAKAKHGGEVVRVEDLGTAPPSHGQSEAGSGNLLPPEIREPVNEAVRQVTEATKETAKVVAKGAAGKIRRKLDEFLKSSIERVDDIAKRTNSKLLTKVTEHLRLANDERKSLRARYDTQGGLYDMRRMPQHNQELERLVKDKFGVASEVGAILRDKPMREHFGDVGPVSAGAQAVVKAHQKVSYEVAKSAVERDTKLQNAEGFATANPERERLTREWTHEGAQGLLTRNDVYHSLRNWLVWKYGVTPEQVDADFSEARALVGHDPIEFRRKYPVMPTHVPAADGKLVRILEGRLREHADRMANRAAAVLSAKSQFPNPEKPNAEDEKPIQGLEDPMLPQPSREVVNSVLNDKELGGEAYKAANEVAMALRAAHNLPVLKNEPWAEPGTDEYTALQTAGTFIGLVKAAHLTGAFVQNITEPVANMQFLGAANTTKAAQEVVRAMFDNKGPELHRTLVGEGWMADSAENHRIFSSNSAERFGNAIHRAGELLTHPIHLTQSFTEMTTALAARSRLTAMQEGNGGQRDVALLRQLGFDEATSQRMVKGRGTVEEYSRYRLGVVGKLAGGRSVTSAERSISEHSKRFNDLVWFMNFFRKRMALVDQLQTQIREAPADSAERARGIQTMMQMAAFTVASGAAGTALQKLLWDGWGGVTDYARESVQSPGSVARSITGLLSQGLLGGFGQPISAAASEIAKGVEGEKVDLPNAIGRTLVRSIGPLGFSVDLFQLGSAVLGSDTKGYEGLSPIEALGKYVRNNAPGVRMIQEGLFGLKFMALTSKDPTLDRAMDSLYRWRAVHKPVPPSEGGTDNREWLAAMRKVIDQVSAGNSSWGDEKLMEALSNAESAKTAEVEKVGQHRPTSKASRQVIASSLRQRKLLPDKSWSTSDTESLTGHLGEENLATLQNFDDALEDLARHISPKAK